MSDFFEIQQQQQQQYMMDMNPIDEDINNVPITSGDLLSNPGQDYYINNNNFSHQLDMAQFSNINCPTANNGNNQVDLGAISAQPVVINNTDYYYNDINWNYSPISEMISTSPQSTASNFSTPSIVSDYANQTQLPQYYPFDYMVSDISSQNQSNVTMDWDHYNNDNIDLSFFNQDVIPLPIPSASMSDAQSTLVNPESMNQQQQIKPTAVNKPVNPKSNSNQSISEMISTSPQSTASNFSTPSIVSDYAVQTQLPQYYPFNYMVSDVSSQIQSNVTKDWDHYNNDNIDLSFFNQDVIPLPISSASMSDAQSTLVNTESMKQQQQIKPTAANKPVKPKSNSNQSSDDLARKLELKRERNRVAARKCRNKKLQLIEEYKKTNAQLQKDIEESEALLRKINARKFELRAALLNALNSYPLQSLTPSTVLQECNEQSIQ
ncbi:hypothetical protein DERF_002719 [Dermatophagoides farinae]|uniref:BZIP domain-containing protein n=1 Tax=Dermatophagoides farinae TaxID=6954 RepID=A0A922LAS3_DERFA|nr:hypothetical protein DERF_002719 [Dermatophagoides farinae]